MTAKIPRNKENDYTREAAEKRANFAKEQTDVELNHVGQFSFDRRFTQAISKILSVSRKFRLVWRDRFWSTANMQKANFLCRSRRPKELWWLRYNRGMKLLHESGGVTTTVVDDAMQRAPVFVFKSAREAQQIRCVDKRKFR